MHTLTLARALLGETPLDDWFGKAPSVALATTPRAVVSREGRSELLRFRSKHGTEPTGSVPFLFIPSMLHRWYVLDLCPGASMAEHLVDHGIDTFCLNWGETEDEDRYLTWEDVQRRIRRAVRKIRALTGARKVALLGYSMGASLASIYTALHPEDVAGLVNLAGPIDFSRGGMLAHLTNPRWFDVDAVSAVGNIAQAQLEAGIMVLRPTMDIASFVEVLGRAGPASVVHRDPASNRDALASVVAIETWAAHDLSVPADVYRTYITRLYQENELFRGVHHVGGKRVDLGNIRCPVLTVAAAADSICPIAAAAALHERVGTTDVELLVVPGGHVGAVVGHKARGALYARVEQFVRVTSAQH